MKKKKKKSDDFSTRIYRLKKRKKIKSSDNLDKRLIELTALFEISQTLNESLNLNAILNNILLVPMGRLMISKGAFFLNRKDSGYILETSKGLPRELIGKSIKITNFPKKPFVIDETRNESWLDFFKQFGFKIIFPIIFKNEILGALSYGNKLTNEDYSQTEIEFLTSLSNIAGTSIQNALVYEELAGVNIKLDKKIQELNTLFEISKELNSTLDADKVIKLLTYALMGQMAVNHYMVFIKNNGKMDLKSYRGVKDVKFSQRFLNKLLKISKPYFIEDEVESDMNKKFIYSGIEVVVPMRLQDETRGIIALGEKVNKQAYSQEDMDFLYTLGNQAMISIENARLFKETLEKQKLEEELATARNIQQQLIPKSFPKIEGFEIAGINIPSKHVGGDYFDIIKIGETKYGVAIADVSGKGIPAALIMSNLQASLRALAQQVNTSICDIISRINNIIHENTESDKFITFFYGILDVSTGEFTYSNAGHNPPYLIKSDNSITLLTEGGVLLGIMKEVKYKEATIRLEHGDRVVMYTDGVTEAINKKEEEFGEKRLEEIIKTNQNLSPLELIEKIKMAVKQFSEGLAQSDDITIMAIRAI
jgi:sigma-B regulation protein RsbU (phosphoserine phosphatase)